MYEGRRGKWRKKEEEEEEEEEEEKVSESNQIK